MNSIVKSVIVCLCLVFTPLAHSNGFDYQLKAELIAKDTYAVMGKTQSFSRQNGGNILNTAFIVTAKGVVVFDSGPSLRYGQQLRQLITKTTNQPIIMVFNSHMHPDHFLGNGAFSDVPIYSSLTTIKSLQTDGDALAEGLYELVGDWMRDTAVVLPQPIAPGLVFDDSEHRLELVSLQGHTRSDLVIFDHHTGVLLAGDLVFNQRAPTTPHADLFLWQGALQRLASFQPTSILPGHGHVATGTQTIEQTKAYLQWLDKLFSQAAEQGLTFHEVKHQQAPFPHMVLREYELERSIIHLYRDYEQRVLD